MMPRKILAVLVGLVLVAGPSAARAQATKTSSASKTSAASGGGCLTWTPVSSPNPDPGYSHLYDVAAISSTDAWAVGSTRNDSFIEHWDGTAWKRVASPDGGPLSAVAAVSSSNVWTVGRRVVEHWNGSSWSVVTTPLPVPINVGASSASNVWILGLDHGDNPVVERWNGSSWNIVATPWDYYYSFGAIDVLSPTDVWLGGGVFNESHSDIPLIEHWTARAGPRVPAPSAPSTAT
jgi:hypothetical protein